MSVGKRFRVSRGDIAVILAVLLFSVLGFLWPLARGSAAGAEVVARGPMGETRFSLAIDAECVIEGRGGRVLLVIEGGAARVAASNCPDRLCVAAGMLRNAGDTAACLPLGVVISVEGHREVGGVDATSW